MAIDQRLLAQPIAGQQQLPSPGVPEGQGEHAVEVLEKLGPFVLVEVDEHFGVALGAEVVPGAFQPAAQVAEVVDFAVEDDPDRAVFVGERLLAAGHVDDRQPAMAQGDAGNIADAVRSAKSCDTRPRRPGRGGAARRSSAGASLAPTALAGSFQTAPAMPHILRSSKQRNELDWDRQRTAGKNQHPTATRRHEPPNSSRYNAACLATIASTENSAAMPLLAGGAQALGQLAVLQHFMGKSSQTGPIADGDQKAGLPVYHQFASAPDIGGHDRHPRRHRLHYRVGHPS